MWGKKPYEDNGTCPYSSREKTRETISVRSPGPLGHSTRLLCPNWASWFSCCHWDRLSRGNKAEAEHQPFASMWHSRYLQDQVGKVVCESCSLPPGSLADDRIPIVPHSQLAEAPDHCHSHLAPGCAVSWLGIHHTLCCKITGRGVCKPVEGGSFIQKALEETHLLAHNLPPLPSSSWGPCHK